MAKEKNDKDEIGNILLKHVLPVYNLSQKGALAPWAPSRDPPMIIAS